MHTSKGQFLLGLLSGSLFTLGFCLLSFYAAVLLFLNHMFIVSARSPAAVLLLVAPALLMLTGFGVFRKARNIARLPVSTRYVVGVVLVLLPVLGLSVVPLFAFAMGSAGMDIHFTPPAWHAYASLAALLGTICFTVLMGVHLLRTGSNRSAAPATSQGK